MRIEAIGKAARLVAMHPREAAYRMRERMRIELDRGRRFMGLDSASEDDLPRAPDPACDDAFSFLQYLRDGPAARFYLPSTPHARRRAVRLFGKLFPEAERRAGSEAEPICAHRVALLGYPEISVGAIINWHRDPVSGRVWPRRFWADYDPVHDPEAGDAKVVHELNRHLHLPRLAKAYMLTGREIGRAHV